VHLLIASSQSQLYVWIGILVAGFLIGIFGHIYGSRPLILLGIVIIGGFSAYFAFGVGHLG
jgi:hypothetical protein